MGGLRTLWVLRPKEFIRQETSSSSVPTLFHFIPLDSSFWHFPFFSSCHFVCFFFLVPFLSVHFELIRSFNEMGGVSRSVVTFSTQITRSLMAWLRYFIIPFDSSGHVLSKVFWHQVDAVKRSAAKSRRNVRMARWRRRRLSGSVFGRLWVSESSNFHKLKNRIVEHFKGYRLVCIWLKFVEKQSSYPHYSTVPSAESESNSISTILHFSLSTKCG